MLGVLLTTALASWWEVGSIEVAPVAFVPSTEAQTQTAGRALAVTINGPTYSRDGFRWSLFSVTLGRVGGRAPLVFGHVLTLPERVWRFGEDARYSFSAGLGLGLGGYLQDAQDQREANGAGFAVAPLLRFRRRFGEHLLTGLCLRGSTVIPATQISHVVTISLEVGWSLGPERPPPLPPDEF